MPIVVDEVIISVEVTNAASGGAGEGGSGAASPASAGAGGGDKQALIAECVERVLEILERREER
jgi:hypothetical protein